MAIHPYLDASRPISKPEIDSLKRHLSIFTAAVLVVLFGSLWNGGASFAQTKMPATLAGTIPPRPAGRIAFIRDGDIWVMDADGTRQQRVAEVKNADGRISWAPDGKRIAYTRAGKVQFQEPDNSGGVKKIYDVFVCFLDSAAVGNTMWWRRLTMDVGGRDPEWSADGQTIYFTRDMNANIVNASSPNYQICSMDDEGGSQVILRKDWQFMKEYFMNPSVSPKGDVAFMHMYENKPQGIAVMNAANFMRNVDSVKLQTKKMLNCISPAWSPDGKWLAYVRNDLQKSGIFVVSADMKTTYSVYEPPASTSMRPIAPSWSPDGKWLTFSTHDGSVYICDITGANLKRLTGPGGDWAPAWSKASKTAAK